MPRKQFPKHLGEPVGFYTKKEVVHPILKSSGSKLLESRIKEEERKLRDNKEHSDTKLHEREIAQIEQIEAEISHEKEKNHEHKKETKHLEKAKHEIQKEERRDKELRYIISRRNGSLGIRKEYVKIKEKHVK